MLTVIGAIDIYACMWCLSRDALMRIRCERNWNWIRIRNRNRKSNSNRNRLWRNRGRTPRVINVVYGVLLTAGKNCTRVFPGNLFFACDLRGMSLFRCVAPSLPCPALPCRGPPNHICIISWLLSASQFKVQQQAKMRGKNNNKNGEWSENEKQSKAKSLVTLHSAQLITQHRSAPYHSL